jgi:hypothetical protein
MKKWIAVLALSTVAFAQPGPGGPPGATPEMQKKLEAYRPVFELTGLVAMLDQVDKQSGLAFTKEQAQKILPILKDLQARTDLKPADAEKILTNLEDGVLSDNQLAWIDKTRLERQEQMRQRQSQNKGQGARLPPGMGRGPGGPGGPGGRGGMQAILQGKPFNPFKEERGKKQLAQLVELMSKK